MQIEKEIERSVKRIAALDSRTSKTHEEQQAIIEKTKEALRNSQYDFSCATSFVLNQNGKSDLSNNMSHIRLRIYYVSVSNNGWINCIK